MQTDRQQQAGGKPEKGPSPVNTDFRAGGEDEKWPEDPETAGFDQFDQEAAIEREKEVQEAEDEDIVENDRPDPVHNAAGAAPEDYDETEDEEEDEAVNFDDLGDEEDEENNY